MVRSSWIWKLPISRTIKIITDLAFSKDKIGIGILVRNHLGISFQAHAIPRKCHFNIDYGEHLTIIENYVIGLSLEECILIENDSLLVIISLTSCDDEFLELGTYILYFS